MKIVKPVSLFLLMIVLAALPGWSQSQDQGPPEDLNRSGVVLVPFNFGPPGARALSMGATFIAIADDATASEANPAGLTILSRPEVSVHVRDSSFGVDVVDLNASAALNLIDFFGSPSVGDSSPIVNFDESVTDVSFASFVKPFGGWAFSIYYQQSINFEGQSDFFVQDTQFEDNYTSRKEVETLLESFGASFAFKLGKMVSLGASARYSRLQIETFDQLRVDLFRDLEPIYDFFGVSRDPLIDFFSFQDVFDDDDEDLTFNIGLLVNPSGKFSFGLVYKNGGEFEIGGQSEEIDCINDPFIFGLTCDPQTQQGSFFFRGVVPTRAVFEIPDFFGIGFAWRPTERLTLGLDVNEITYSDLAPEPVEGVTEAVDDEIEIHFGLEYTLLTGSAKKTPISFRAGFWTDEDHDGFAAIDSDQTHVTAGIGAVFKDLQVDLAGHFSDTVDEGLLSLVYRF